MPPEDVPDTEEDGVELEGDDTPYPNVFVIGTGQPYIPPPPTPRERIVAKTPDVGATNLLKSAAVDYEAGKFHGLIAVMGVFDESGNLVNYRMIASEVACAYPMSFLGALEQVKASFVGMSFGHPDEGEFEEPLEEEDEYEIYD